MFSPGRAVASGASFETSGIPAGFDELASDHEALVDVYFGGRKIGEALAVTRPGYLQFHDPAGLLPKIPEIIPAPEFQSALAAEFPTNSRAACSVSGGTECGTLEPGMLAIIYDEDRFRVDLFINPRFLRTAHVTPTGYLPVPDALLSVVDTLGAAVSGKFGDSPAYNIQNRTIIGLRNARLRANLSIASHLGPVVDDLVGEIDRGERRYSGGLFWTPGNDFTGQRRIVGAGFGTQFDTWADREELRGTPLILFLARPARVEILADGRLMSSRVYPSGNVQLDTSALADGSYSVLLRIHEPSGSVREERRFFVKNAQVAPAGHPIYYAYAGLLANTRRYAPISLSGTFYYQAGMARRLGNDLALDIGLIGTQHKASVEAGAWIMKGPARIRAAGLISSAGDTGALLQFTTGGHGPLSISFDARRIWSRDGQPLVPLPSYVDTFGLTPPTGVQLAHDSYTQATGSIGLRLGGGYVALVGSYRKDKDLRADYSIGPNINWPLITRSRMQLVFEASGQHTRSSTAAFAGVRALFTSGRMSMQGTLGQGYQDERGEPAISRAVGSLGAQYSSESADRTLVNAEAGLNRDIETSSLHAGTTVDSRLGDLRADLLHNFEGPGGTQYDLAFQTAVALGSGAAALGGRDLEQSAIVVRLGGDKGDTMFDVLVNEVARGRLKAGERLSLFVPGYHTYNVRLVPTGGAPASYDTAARQVTLYPGNVRSLAWDIRSVFTIFAQAIGSDGAPVADSLVQSPKSIAETDSNGYFQLDVRRGDPISIARSGGAACHVTLPSVVLNNDFASLGKVLCQ